MRRMLKWDGKVFVSMDLVEKLMTALEANEDKSSNEVFAAVCLGAMMEDAEECAPKLPSMQDLQRNAYGQAQGAQQASGLMNALGFNP